jgi:hypothetical protein
MKALTQIRVKAGFSDYVFALALASISLGSATGAEITVRVREIPIDPSISRLTTEELIDRLQLESQRWVPSPGPFLLKGGGGSHLETPALEHSFLPLDANGRFEENLTRRPRSPAMTELVRRGVVSLPALLVHLTDGRPTGVFWNPPLSNGQIPIMMGGPVGLGDVYDPRYYDEARWPKDANTARIKGYRPLPSGQYRYKVADLCYAAIGQIVNRSLLPRGTYFSGDTLVINGTSVNSPVEFPGLAHATYIDWSNLSEGDHERSLADDAQRQYVLNGHPDEHAWGGVQRLLFYYPTAGRKVVEPLLERTLIGLAIDHPAKPGGVSYLDQIDLVSELEPFDWDGLDVEIYGIYKRTVNGPRQTVEDLLYGGRLAFACAKRIVHRGHDREFGTFFRERISLEEDSMRTPNGNGYRYAFGEESKHYKDLIGELEAQAN